MNDTKTVSGAIVHVTDADEAPLVKCLVDITPEQSGTGTPSPENVRPISGWESVSVNDTGKNMLEVSMTDGEVGGVTYTKNADGSISCVGTITGTQVKYISSTASITSLKEGVTYVLSGGNEVSASGIRVVSSIKNADGSVARWIDVTTASGYTFTLSAGQTLTSIYLRGATTGTEVNVTIRPMIRLASEDATFAPYTGTTTTTSLGRTVYGGTLDVVSGVLTVDKGYMNYSGSENWAADSNGNRYTIGVAGSYREGYTRIQVISNEGAFSSGSSVGTIFLSNSQLYYYPPTSVTSLAEFKTWLGSNNLQVVYPLATPQTYTLTGQEVSTLLGENNVWADSGDVEITYHTDTLGIYNKIYINGRPYFRPNDFEIKREDVYAGEYTTCTGKLIADKIGWKYSDLPMKWDILPDDDLVYLTTLTGAFDILFRDSDGQHTEQVIRRAFTNTPTRTTGPEGTKIWTGVEMEVSFLNTHPINE